MFWAWCYSHRLDLAIEYVNSYLRSNSESYKKIWYQLNTSSDSKNWPNVLLILELLFILSFSTAKVECLFSTLKAIKTQRRTNLQCSKLNDLLEINTDGPSLANFSPHSAIALWWNNCSSGCCVNQKIRQSYKRKASSREEDDSSDESEDKFSLECWDN